MKNSLLYFLLFFISFSYSQTVFFNTGINMTTYDYKNSDGNSNKNLNSSNGIFYELGYGIPIDYSKRNKGSGRYSKMLFKTSLNLNSYNGTGGNSMDNYDWESQYIGLKAGLEYHLFDISSFTAALEGSFGFETFLNGKQKIGGKTYDLKDSDEFNGLFVTPKIGINILYNVTQDVGLSGGIHFSKALSMRGEIEGEKLQFNNFVLSFGVIIQTF
jgi:hypothetical protein